MSYRVSRTLDLVKGVCAFVKFGGTGTVIMKYKPFGPIVGGSLCMYAAYMLEM